MAGDMVFGPELVYVGIAWQSRRDKLWSTLGSAMGSGIVSATVKISHKVFCVLP